MSNTPQQNPFLQSATTLDGTETVATLQGGFPVAMTVDQIATYVQTDGGIGPEDLILECRNESGGSMAAGSLVYISGYSAAQSRPLISKADADVAGASAQWVVRDAISNNANGTVYKTATLTAQDTGGGAVGDPFFLSTTAGAGTKTAPTGSDDIVQVVGQVTAVDGSAGTVAVNLFANAAFKSIATNEIQASSVTAAKLADAVADALWKVTISAGAEAGDKIVLTVQAVDLQGNNLAATTNLVFKPVTAVDASYSVTDEGAGTSLSTSGDKVSRILTNASGVAEIGITDTAAETIILAFETPQGPIIQSLTFA